MTDLSDENDKTQHEAGPSGPAEAIPAAPAEAVPPGTPDETKTVKKHADHDEAKSLKGKLRKKEHEIKELRADLESWKDRFLRAAAEMDNQKKRLERDKAEFYQFALNDVLKDVLAVLDNFERALMNRDQVEVKGFQDGVELIAKQVRDLLAKRGVTEVEAMGRPFDPSVHQAVLTEDAAGVTDPVVGAVLQKGYRLNDRLLRPALVKVLVPVKN